MATGILQPDGTRCYSGPTCIKHSYTDSHGNPTTRAALVEMIDNAMDGGEFDVYYRERQNLEDLDATRTESFDGDEENGVIPNVQTTLNRSEDEIWDDFEESKLMYNADWYNPAQSDYINVNEIGDVDPDVTLTHREVLLLASYNAAATERGSEEFDRQYDFKRVMSDEICILPTQGANINVYIQESNLVVKKQVAAENHIKWKKSASDKFNYMVSIGSSKEEAVNNLLVDVRQERESNEKLLQREKFEFRYNRQTLDYDSYNDVEPKIIESVKKIQFLHDSLIYSKIQENDLRSILE